MRACLITILLAAFLRTAGAQSASELLFSLDREGVPVPTADTRPEKADVEDEDFSPELPQGKPPAFLDLPRGGSEENEFSKGGEGEKAYTAENIPYLDIVLKKAREQNFDPEMILAVIKKESSFNPKAKSKAGARGLMQLMPGTAKWLGLKKDPFNKLYEPSINIKYGVKYLRYLFDKFCESDYTSLEAGDLEDQSVKKSIAAYNAGPGNVMKYSAEPYNGIPPFKETQSYLKLVSRYFQEFEALDIPQEPAPAK